MKESSFVIRRWSGYHERFCVHFSFSPFGLLCLSATWYLFTICIAQTRKCWCMEFDGSRQLWLCLEGCWRRTFWRWTNGNSDSFLEWSSRAVSFKLRVWFNRLQRVNESNSIGIKKWLWLWCSNWLFVFVPFFLPAFGLGYLRETSLLATLYVRVLDHYWYDTL